MKLLAWGLLLAAVASAQTSNLAAGGVSYTPGTVAGTGIYARLLTGGTWAFAAVDALPVTVQPLIVTTSFSFGAGQKLCSLGSHVDIYVPTSAGISYSGTGNVGWAATTGAMAALKWGQFRVLPNVRVVKSSVSAGSGYQLVGGLLFGFGW